MKLIPATTALLNTLSTFQIINKMFKSVFVIAVLLVMKVLAAPWDTRPIPLEVAEVTVIALEEPCVRQGGMCTRREQCQPNEIVGLTGLCPKQSHMGVICCYL